MQVRWSLDKATILVFGHTKDRSYITLNKEGCNKKPAGPTKAIDLHSMTEKELNNICIPATRERKRIRRALGKQTSGKEISYEMLYNYWSTKMSSKLEVDADPPQFPGRDETLQNLWGQMLFDDDNIPQITNEHICSAVNNLKNEAAPGYDGLTREHWKLCHNTALQDYLQRLIQFQVDRGIVLSTWKVGIVTFLPKPDKPDEAYADPKAWRSITVLPDINKIIGKIIVGGSRRTLTYNFPGHRKEE